MEPTVRDVLAFHRVDRAAYERLLSLSVGRLPSRDAVALLMWLHRRAGVDAVAGVCLLVRTPADAARLVSEARAVLLHGATCTHRGAAETPIISSMCGGGGEAGAIDDVVRRFFSLIPDDDDAPRRGVAQVLDGVGALVFDDRLHVLLRRYEEGSGGELPVELAAPYRRGCGAVPSSVTAENDGGRSLFITFSKGFPLTREDIDGYFTERWGRGCVERILMERTPPGQPPAYGRVVFRRASVAAAVLGGQRLAKLVVNGRHLWARNYVPRVQHH